MVVANVEFLENKSRTTVQVHDFLRLRLGLGGKGIIL
jgi:hypothetical protein